MSGSEVAGNRAKAPEVAAFVDSMREVFGADQVKVVYVREGDFELGDKDAAAS